MDIITPTGITSVAWEGELVTPAVTMSPKAPRVIPVITIGKPEIWPAARALEIETGKKWTPPLGRTDFWLVRLACTLREPGGLPTLTEAVQTLYLRPRNSNADAGAVYAHSLFPDRLTAEDKSEFSATLGPELKFGKDVSYKIGELGAKIEYRKVFPVVQSFDVGTATPYWVFRPHATNPLDGSQCVYAVVGAQATAGGARASIELVVTSQTRFGPVRFGLPEEAQAHTSFTIP